MVGLHINRTEQAGWFNRAMATSEASALFTFNIPADELPPHSLAVLGTILPALTLKFQKSYNVAVFVGGCAQQMSLTMLYGVLNSISECFTCLLSPSSRRDGKVLHSSSSRDYNSTLTIETGWWRHVVTSLGWYSMARKLMENGNLSG